jgi:hypothetical protein
MQDAGESDAEGDGSGDESDGYGDEGLSWEAVMQGLKARSAQEDE